MVSERLPSRTRLAPMALTMWQRARPTARCLNTRVFKRALASARDQGERVRQQRGGSNADARCAFPHTTNKARGVVDKSEAASSAARAATHPQGGVDGAVLLEDELEVLLLLLRHLLHARKELARHHVLRRPTPAPRSPSWLPRRRPPVRRVHAPPTPSRRTTTRRTHAVVGRRPHHAPPPRRPARAAAREKRARECG